MPDEPVPASDINGSVIRGSAATRDEYRSVPCSAATDKTGRARPATPSAFFKIADQSRARIRIRSSI